MNVFELFAKLGLDTREYEEGLGDSEKKGEAAGNKIQKIMSGAAAVTKKAITFSATAVAAVTGLGVKEYAEYEQLVGGVDTLFKDSSKKVQEYASNAYKTAGMSANQYMDTVTSFSASLLQSLGGDTDKAASVADQAITDMSDNANKMGTSMDLIQNAYQGFAKQNYTMLDNLKLGYGGTKTEMERLLADAEKISGVKYDISSYADITEAIHVIQTEMGITGTTAKEAATTIEGSTNMMKSSWHNLLVGIADDTQPVGPLIEQLVDSAKTFGDNVIPRIQKTLTGIGEAVEYVVPVLAQELPGTLAAVAPGMVTAVYALITSVGSAFIQYGPSLLDSGVTAVSQLITGFAQGLDSGIPTILAMALPMLLKFSEQLRGNAGTLIDAGLQFLIHLASGIAKGIPVLVQYAPTIITNFAGLINDNAPKLVTAGVKIIVELGKGLIKAIPTIIQNIPQIIKAIIAVFTAFNWLNIGKNLVSGISKGIKSAKSLAKKEMTNVKTAVVGAIKNLPNTLKSLGTNGVKSIGNALKSGVSTLGNVAKTILNAIVSVITGLPSRLFTIGKNAVTRVKSAFTSVSWRDIGLNLIKGIASGITAGISWVVNAAKNAIKKATSSAKNEADINSPSKVWEDEIGIRLPQGAARGIEKDNSPEKAANDKISSILEAAKGRLSSAEDIFDGNTTQKTNVQQSGNDIIVALLKSILDEIQTINDEMFDRIVRALESVGIKINKRELARLVREVS